MIIERGGKWIMATIMADASQVEIMAAIMASGIADILGRGLAKRPIGEQELFLQRWEKEPEFRTELSARLVLYVDYVLQAEVGVPLKKAKVSGLFRAQEALIEFGKKRHF
jgi:hypothetical protein